MNTEQQNRKYLNRIGRLLLTKAISRYEYVQILQNDMFVRHDTLWSRWAFGTRFERLLNPREVAPVVKEKPKTVRGKLTGLYVGELATFHDLPPCTLVPTECSVDLELVQADFEKLEQAFIAHALSELADQNVTVEKEDGK